MKVHAFFEGGYASVCYLAVSEDGSAAVIDPSASPHTVRAAFGALPHVDAILLTHGHFDHMLALEAWRSETGAPVMICASDAAYLTDASLNCNRVFFGKDITYSPADRLLSDGDIIPIGNETLRVKQTPGHTPGSCLYIGDGVLFTGDTIMSDGAYGRYDLPGGSARALYHSLEAIMQMEGDMRLYPGHGRESTLTEEKKYHHYHI